MDASAYENVAPRELKSKLDAGESTVLLDVREPWEFELAHYS
jgi:rhodanese-related sulfurtransferase